MAAVVSVDSLIKIYSSDLMLDKISFEVMEGECCAIAGPEDSGKTPLLEILANLKFADSGVVETPVMETRYVPDGVIAYEHITAEQLFLQTFRMYHITDPDECNRLCDLFNIDMKKKLLDMSYMENRCVAYINALITKPKLLIIDEPYHYLTEEVYEKLLHALKRRCGHGMTVIVSCDTFSDVKGYADRYVFISEGDLVKTGKVPKDFRPWRMVTVYDCELDKFKELGASPIQSKGRVKHFIYKQESGKLLQALLDSGCSDFLIEELTLEEQLFYNFERWS